MNTDRGTGPRPEAASVSKLHSILCRPRRALWQVQQISAWRWWTS